MSSRPSKPSKPRLTHRLACKITLLDPHTALASPPLPLLDPRAPWTHGRGLHSHRCPARAHLFSTVAACAMRTPIKEKRGDRKVSWAFSVTAAFHLLTTPAVYLVS